MPDQIKIKEISARIYNALLKEGIPGKLADVIVRQSWHETSFDGSPYNSNVFKTNNNAFGMKMPSIRKSPYIQGIGTKAPGNEGPTPYAKYARVEDSARDLAHWLRYNKADYSRIDTPETYAEWLKSKSYYGPSAAFYGGAIRAALERTRDWVFANPKKSIGLILGVSALVIGGYFLLKKKPLKLAG